MKLSARGAAIVAQASVLEKNSASAPGGFLNFAFCLLIFDMTLPNEPHFKTPHLCNLRNLWYFVFYETKPI